MLSVRVSRGCLWLVAPKQMDRFQNSFLFERWLHRDWSSLCFKIFNGLTISFFLVGVFNLITFRICSSKVGKHFISTTQRTKKTRQYGSFTINNSNTKSHNYQQQYKLTRDNFHESYISTQRVSQRRNRIGIASIIRSIN